MRNALIFIGVLTKLTPPSSTGISNTSLSTQHTLFFHMNIACNDEKMLYKDIGNS